MIFSLKRGFACIQCIIPVFSKANRMKICIAHWYPWHHWIDRRRVNGYYHIPDKYPFDIPIIWPYPLSPTGPSLMYLGHSIVQSSTAYIFGASICLRPFLTQSHCQYTQNTHLTPTLSNIMMIGSILSPLKQCWKSMNKSGRSNKQNVAVLDDAGKEPHAEGVVKLAYPNKAFPMGKPAFMHHIFLFSFSSMFTNGFSVFKKTHSLHGFFFLGIKSLGVEWIWGYLYCSGGWMLDKTKAINSFSLLSSPNLNHVVPQLEIFSDEFFISKKKRERTRTLLPTPPAKKKERETHRSWTLKSHLIALSAFPKLYINKVSIKQSPIYKISENDVKAYRNQSSHILRP
ncbi:hypothetical protein VP01_238g3 [Puccinia sorghi]|uniref:Uncharacterized protein n=1 Tax=Puccinia sorghi TaxID=27349 RepID=A0A0L6V6S5_9BASI|nr:hypothetical protein VP01_238g3 [Puccinia sorghi]